MASGDLRATYAAIIAAVRVGDDAAFDRLLDNDFVDHNPVPGQPPGRAGFAYWAASARAAFADLHGTVEDTLVDGDKLAGRTTWRGTHTGSFLGIPATGRGIQFAAFHIVRFADGLAAEWWGTDDLLTAPSSSARRFGRRSDVGRHEMSTGVLQRSLWVTGPDRAPSPKRGKHDHTNEPTPRNRGQP